MQFGSRESPLFAHADVYMKIKIKIMESLDVELRSKLRLGLLYLYVTSARAFPAFYSREPICIV
jgi:hypothetical protein